MPSIPDVNAEQSSASSTSSSTSTAPVDNKKAHQEHKEHKKNLKSALSLLKNIFRAINEVEVSNINNQIDSIIKNIPDKNIKHEKNFKALITFTQETLKKEISTRDRKADKEKIDVFLKAKFTTLDLLQRNAFEVVKKTFHLQEEIDAFTNKHHEDEIIRINEDLNNAFGITKLIRDSYQDYSKGENKNNTVGDSSTTQEVSCVPTHNQVEINKLTQQVSATNSASSPLTDVSHSSPLQNTAQRQRLYMPSKVSKHISS
jgi:hypothetical protein